MIRPFLAGCLLIAAGCLWEGWVGVFLVFSGGLFFGEAASPKKHRRVD